jgi:hypothetical protein
MPYKHPREIEKFENFAIQKELALTPNRGRKLPVKKAGFIECGDCEADFWPTGEEPRPRPFLLCPRCRKKKESEAKLFGRTDDLSQLSDFDLDDQISFRIRRLTLGQLLDQFS